MTTIGDRPDMVDSIIRYEGGDMTHHEMVEFFQDLVNTGLAWQLQGSYGRQAQRLIDAGEIKRPANA